MIPLSQIQRALEACGLVQGQPSAFIRDRLAAGLHLADSGHRVLAFYLHEMEAGRHYQDTGHSSAVDYAEKRLGMDRRRAAELIAVGKKLLTLPALDHAFCRRELSWSKVLLILPVVTPEHEEAWLARARELPCRKLALQVKLSRPGSAPRAPGDRKGLPEIRYPVNASVPTMTHAKLEAAKQKMAAECGRPVSGAEFLDGLADLYLQVLEDGTVPGKIRVDSSLYRIVLRPEEGSEELTVDTEDGPVPVEGGDLLRCDAEVMVVRDDDGPDGGDGPDGPSGGRGSGGTRRCPGGRRHHHGGDAHDVHGHDVHTHDVHTHDAHAQGGRCNGSDPGFAGEKDPPTPAWLRARIFARDGNRCRACGSRRGLMAHHIRWRSRGGKTKAWNLCLLCVTCHALVHEGLLVIVGEHEREIRFEDREGKPLHGPGGLTCGAGLPGGIGLLVPPPAQPAVPAVTLDTIPATIDAAWWDRHEHLIRVGSRGLEFEEGTPHVPAGSPAAGGSTVAAGPVPEHAPAGFDAEAFRAAFGSLVGQEALVDRFETAGKGSAVLGTRFPHTLLCGPPGTGKTTIAQAIASAFGRSLVKAVGPLVTDVPQLLRHLAGVREGDVLFLEEVHAVPKPVLEALYEAMAEQRLSLTIHAGAKARTLTFDLPAFTLVAATTEDGALPTPFVSRFGLRETLAPYEEEVLADLATAEAAGKGVTLEPSAARRLAAFARGTPREAIRLLSRVLESVASVATPARRIERPIGERDVARCLERLGYDATGLDPLEQRYLRVLGGSLGPLSLARLASLLGSSCQRLFRDVEPHLLRRGLVEVTPRGRVACRLPEVLAV